MVSTSSPSSVLVSLRSAVVVVARASSLARLSVGRDRDDFLVLASGTFFTVRTLSWLVVLLRGSRIVSTDAVESDVRRCRRCAALARGDEGRSFSSPATSRWPRLRRAGSLLGKETIGRFTGIVMEGFGDKISRSLRLVDLLRDNVGAVRVSILAENEEDEGGDVGPTKETLETQVCKEGNEAL